MLNTLCFKNANFISKHSDVKSLPIDKCIEIAIIGKSNTGKSSMINVLFNKIKLSKVSKIQGSTKFINLFKLNKNIRIVDLPGYGYIYSFKEKHKIKNLLNFYLKYRKNLKLLLILIDIRRCINEVDKKILFWAKTYNIPFYIFLTKVDKLSKINCKKELNKKTKIIKNLFNTVNIYVFSSKKRIGLKILKNKIKNFYKKKNHINFLKRNSPNI